MTLFVSCACGKTLRVPDTAAGKQVRCPQCGAVLPVPAAVVPEVVEPENYAFRDAEPPPPEPREPAPRRERPIRWKSRHNATRKRAQKYAYLGTGAMLILVGMWIIFVTVSSQQFRFKLFALGLTLSGAGVVGIIQALTDTIPDE